MGRDPKQSAQRPRHSAKRGRGIDESRRARLYLGELLWLEGWPETDRWRCSDTDELMALDGARISKSRRAARTVIREHPIALREEVGDIDRWWAAIDAKLAWCSALLSGKAAYFDPTPHLPSRLARQLAGIVRGPLGRAAGLAAISWCANHDRLARTLDWIEHEIDSDPLVALAERAHVGEVGFERLVLMLSWLATSGGAGNASAAREAGVTGLIAALAIDAPDPQCALDLTRNVESRLLDQRPTATVDPGRTGDMLVAWTLRLAVRDAGIRQRSLALFGVAHLAEAFGPWEVWEHANAGLLARANELAGHVFDHWERSKHLDQVIENLKAARAKAPQPLALQHALIEIDMLASVQLQRFHPSIVRLLAALPASMPPHARARLLLHLARIAACAGDQEHFEWLWDAVGEALERGRSPELLSPWQSVIATGARIWVDSDLIEGMKTRADLKRLLQVLAELVVGGALTADDATRAATWLAAGLPTTTLVELTAICRDTCTRMAVEASHAAIAISDGTAKDLAAVAKPLFALLDEMTHHAAQRLLQFTEQLARTGAGWIVRGALLAHQHARIADAASVVTSISKVKAWPALLEPAEVAWIERYPPVLARALQRLASADADAERIAAKRLADDLPDPAELEREIAALRASGKAPKRLANLERRLASPTVPSPKRLANLADKLETTARELALTRFVAEATAISGTKVIRMFGLPGWPTWAEPADRTAAARIREILFALVELEHPMDRELAGRLLRARSGPRPWDLRDERVNRTFLDRMRAASIDPGPWLDETPRTVEVKGEPVSLALSGDPIEVFAMGLHFDTCLAPRGCNFFSVVANAADINKRVLYAYKAGARREGRVIGRCLFAITDALALLVFHPYCHEAIDFTGIVRDFASDLAKRMGTTLVARGSVRTLLAREWYDDGARDLTGRFEGLAEDFDLRTIAPEQLIDRLRELLGRDLDDVTLPLVINHRSLRLQPRHLAPLVPFVLTSATPQTRIDAALLAYDNGDPKLADRLLGDHDHAVQLDGGWGWGEMVARLRPSKTLARLRRMRPRHVRRWSDDRGHRTAIAGVAFEALGRPRKAAAMYRLAMRDETWLADLMRGRLTALGAPIEGEVAD